MRRLIAAFVVLVAACAWDAITPANNPESREYPCGPRGLVCGGRYPHADCCWQGDTCGGVDPTCPAGMCCWVGPSDDPNSLGGSPNHVHTRPQWTPTR